MKTYVDDLREMEMELVESVNSNWDSAVRRIWSGNLDDGYFNME